MKYVHVEIRKVLYTDAIVPVPDHLSDAQTEDLVRGYVLDLFWERELHADEEYEMDILFITEEDPEGPGLRSMLVAPPE